MEAAPLHRIFCIDAADEIHRVLCCHGHAANFQRVIKMPSFVRAPSVVADQAQDAWISPDGAPHRAGRAPGA